MGARKEEKMKIIKTSKKHPTFFAEKVLGDKLWEKQKRILNAIQHSDVSVASCHGAGKSFIASRIVLHAMSVLPGTQVITTAPTNRQVKKVLWKEIRLGHKNSNMPLGGKLLTQEWQVDDDWYALGFATSDSDQFQGIHGKKILVVADEAAGVDESIFNGIDGITSGANCRKLYIGNPTTRSGRFYQSFNNSRFKKFSISAFDTPNFTQFGITYDDIIKKTWWNKLCKELDLGDLRLNDENWNKVANMLPYPQLVTPRWVADRFEIWGAESALFQAKVMGKFPEDEQYTIIPIYIYKGAQESEEWPKIDNIRGAKVGLDVARYGNDRTSLFIKVKDKIVEKRSIREMDTHEVTQWADRIIRNHFNTYRNWKDICINIDVIGVGAGVADNLRSQKGYTNVNDIKVSEKANDESKFINKRAEMYWNAREDMKSGNLKIGLHDDELENEITAIRYEYKNGRLKLESKERIRKRLGSSPDEADALCLANYEVEGGGSSGGFLNAWRNN